MNKTNTKKLFIAIENHDRARVIDILNQELAATETVGFHNRFCRDKTPLMFAMQCEDFELADELIEMGANVNATMPNGPRSSVIQLAVSFGHGLNPNFEKWIAFVGKIIQLGANPSEALWPACHAYNKMVDRPEMISLLIDSGASPNFQVGNGLDTVRQLVEINSKHYSSQILKMFGL